MHSSYSDPNTLGPPVQICPQASCHTGCSAAMTARGILADRTAEICIRAAKGYPRTHLRELMLKSKELGASVKCKTYSIY